MMTAGATASSAPVIVIGGGGHARVLIEALLKQGRYVMGFTAPEPCAKDIFGVRYFGSDDALSVYKRDSVRLVNGVGSRRQEIYEMFTAAGFTFDPVIHPSAILATDVELAAGAQIMAGVILQTGVVVGNNSIINTRASVDHDCRVGAHVHIAPGATLAGGIRVGEGTLIGAGAVVIQGVKIGARSTVAAGAVVIRDVPSLARVAGTPAREIRRDV